jgi:hypothetical protein
LRPARPPPVKLATVLGIGKDAKGAFYLADDRPFDINQLYAPDNEYRVFVSDGKTLHRDPVTGSGYGGPPSVASYDISFEEEDGGPGRSLFIETKGGTVTSMEVGSDTTKEPSADAGDQPLTVVDSMAIAAFQLQDLPMQVADFDEVTGTEDVILVTWATQPNGFSQARLYYGSRSQMAERPIVSYEKDFASETIAFAVGSATYTAHFTWTEIDGGEDATKPGPGTLTTGDGTVPVLGESANTSLSGLSFVCPTG